MFDCSAPFTVFDYLRVPHRVTGGPGATGGLERASGGAAASLYWPSEQLLAQAAPPGRFHLVRDVPFVGRVLPDRELQTLARQLPGSWARGEAVRDDAGGGSGAIWRSNDGSALLPFDPNEVLTAYWTERYVELGPAARRARAATLARDAYYRARPFLPRDAQMWLRRRFSRIQRRAEFPRWPIETAVDDFLTLLLELVAGLVAGPVPYIGFWPDGHSWAFVLTHDVEEREGYANLRRLLEIELEHGYRSSWNFVPRNGYVVEEELLDELRARGFEIGVHGLYHDGRDLSARALPQRLAPMRSYAEEWDAAGFRSPATLRSAELIPLLGFDYDSSYSDTAPFEPQAGGCCTWLPYMLEGTVELPITLVQDHTLFELLEHRDASLWLEKARFLRERGGMALLVTHPDYVGNALIVDSYRQLLKEFASDDSAWKPLPSDVSAWWRRRAASTLVGREGEWQVVGPAAGEARVAYVGEARVTA